MRAIRGTYINGRISLPRGLKRRGRCEVTILFPDEDEDAREAEERFRKAAGAWRDLDLRKLKDDIYGARKISRRKAPQL